MKKFNILLYSAIFIISFLCLKETYGMDYERYNLAVDAVNKYKLENPLYNRDWNNNDRMGVIMIRKPKENISVLSIWCLESEWKKIMDANFFHELQNHTNYIYWENKTN